MADLNLPPAPEGHFWRITTALGMPRVLLRKRVWFFSVLVDDVIPVGESSPEKNVLFGAELILHRLAERERSEDFMNQFGGDHD